MYKLKLQGHEVYKHEKLTYVMLFGKMCVYVYINVYVYLIYLHT